MSFRFSLATVLRFREGLEQREELTLQKIHAEIARVENLIDQLTTEIANAQTARNRAMQQPVPALQLHSVLNDVNAAVEQKKTLVETLRTLEQQRDQQVRVYQAAHRGRQMLSDMVDRQRDAYDLERSKTQQKFLDDIFGARHQRS